MTAQIVPKLYCLIFCREQLRICDDLVCRLLQISNAYYAITDFRGFTFLFGY